MRWGVGVGCWLIWECFSMGEEGSMGGGFRGAGGLGRAGLISVR